MANIDEYISYLDKNASRESTYSGFNSFGNRKMSNARQYKSLLQKGKEIITKMEEIQKKYPEGTKVENFNEEDKQEFLQLQKQLDEVQEQQEGYISFDIPDTYKEDSVSVYKYQQTKEIGQNIIAEMEELRTKYFPNVSLENFSEDDRNRFTQLEIQLSEVQRTQKDLEFKIPYMHKQQGDLESIKRGMLQRTSGQIPEISHYEVMDSDFLVDNFKESMRLAQIAVDAELNALNNGDYDRAKDCMSVYSVAYSNFSAHYFGESSAKQLTEYIENKLGEKHKEILQQKVEEYQTLSPDMSNEEIIAQFTDFSNISRICHTSAASEEKAKAKEILLKVAKDKVAQLDKELIELKEHIELPKNEAKIEEIQTQIEELETAWSTTLEHTMGKEKSEHKKAKIEEQGIDMSEIIGDIQETDKRKGRISQADYDRINGAVTKKSEYLEKKLAYLQQYRDIPGNEERIAELENQIETMQDSWVIAINGVDLQVIIDKNNVELDEKRARLPEAEKELAYTIKHEPSKVGLIQRLRYEVKELMESIDKLENENSSIQDGTNKKYIGEHHKGRLDNDEQLKAEQAEKLRLQKERIEQKQKESIEQEERGKAEREEKRRKANEEWIKQREEQRLKREQEAKAKAEEQARIKAEKEVKAKVEKERQMAIEKDIREYEQYEELATRKPEIEELYNQLYYEDFSSQANGQISENMGNLMRKVKDLPDEEKSILLNRYNKNATYQINEQGIFADEEVRKKAEQESKTRAEEQARIKAEKEAKAKAEEQARIKAEQEEKIKTKTMEYMSCNLQNFSSTTKTHEQQQPEKIKPQEKSIRDEVGDEFKKPEQEMQEIKNPTVDLWMNRFSSWYSAIDRVSQNVKAKFVKMKSDIIKAISDKIKERSNKQEISKNQDENER